MDIRKFFGPAGGTKRPSTDTKAPAPATKSKHQETKQKNAAKPQKKLTPGSATSLKSKPLPKPLEDEVDDDDVQIIADSDDELTNKKLFGKTYGRNGSNGRTYRRNASNGKSSKTNGKDPSPAESEKTADEKDKKLEKTASKAASSAPEVKSKTSAPTTLSEVKSKTSAPTTPSEGKSKKPASTPPRDSNKKSLVSSDSDGEVAKRPSRSGKRRTYVIESEPDVDEASPVKRPPSSRNKRRLQELSDSDDEKDKEEVKPKRGPKRSKVKSDEDKEPKAQGKGNRIFDSDSDKEEDTVAPKKRGRRKKKEAVVIVGDDSDEDGTPRRGSMDAFVIHNAPKTTKETESKKPPEEKKQKTISAVDFFGGGPVQRKDKPTLPAKRKAEQLVDTELHEDDDFMKTLEEMDKEQTKKPRRDVTPKKEKADQEEGPAEGSSLASKLSVRMKTVTGPSPSAAVATTTMTATTAKWSPVKRDTNSNVVPDTPDDRKTPRKGTKAKGSPVTGVSKMEVTKKEKPSPPSSTERKTTSPKEGEKSGSSSAEKKTPAKTSPKGESEKGSAKRNWGAYRSFLNREGPRALGSKEIPEGAENCLEGLTFVITGVLESMERDETKSMVERYGGKVTGSISNRTSYLVLGRDPGQSKVTKAEQCKTKQLDEDGLLDLIRTLPGKKSKYVEKAEQSWKKEQSLQKSSSGKFTALKSSDSRPTSSHNQESGTSVADSGSTGAGATRGGGGGEPTLMWVDKHKPSSVKQIIGQQGDKSNAKKLLSWLKKWHKNRAAGVKPTGRFGQDDGSGFRAALLSGPPGIGKTTSAVLVCKEAGFSTVELNASDKRSKRSLKEDVAEALDNQTMVDYLGDGSSGSKHQAETTAEVRGEHHCLIMDEVDGMAGNEDRGGLQELVTLIKATRIPIICICNDRNSLKMRTLAGYCLDLRFQRPRLEQIKGALMSMAYKEGLKISPPAMQQIILSSNQDIRQCIHNLSMWTANHKELSYDQAKQDAKMAQKDLRLGIFDVSRKIFAGGEETAKMTLNDKSDLFFQDYSFVPLFVHENYASVTPYAARGDRKKHLSLLARAADSISEGDLVDKQVRGSGSWNLLPIQAMYASVIPGAYMQGSMSHMVQFPAWLGKNSTTGKNDRILQELRSHMALQVSCDKRGLNMDYMPALRSHLTGPLVTQGSEGVGQVIKLMDDYDITKDDYDNVLEISKWPNSKDPLAHLDSKTKAAFTRQYNKEGHLTPYATGVAPKKRGRGAGTTEDYGMEEGEEGGAPPSPASDSENEAEEGLERDSMIKVRKNSNSKAQTSDSKGKGSAKGKGPAKGKGDSAKGKGDSAKGKGKGKGQR